MSGWTSVAQHILVPTHGLVHRNHTSSSFKNGNAVLFQTAAVLLFGPRRMDRQRGFDSDGPQSEIARYNQAFRQPWYCRTK